MKLTEKKSSLITEIIRLKSTKETRFEWGVGFADKETFNSVRSSLIDCMTKNPLYYLSKNISDDIINGRFVILESSYDTYVNEGLQDKGIFILSNNLSLLYDFSWNDPEQKISYKIHLLISGNTLVQSVYGDLDPSKNVRTVKHLPPKQAINGVVKNPFSDIDPKELLQITLNIIVFKKYSPLTSVYLDSLNKKQTLNKVQHKNDTSIPLTVLDSLWFAEVMKQKKLDSCGHFKLSNTNGDESSQLLKWVKGKYKAKKKSVNQNPIKKTKLITL